MLQVKLRGIKQLMKVLSSKTLVKLVPVVRLCVALVVIQGETLIEAKTDLRVLLFSKTLLYRHASIPNGIRLIQRLAGEQGFQVEATEDSGAFTPVNLTRFQVVVFLSTSGDVLDKVQESAFRDFVENGGGFVAIHASVAGKLATEGDWPWYREVFCTEFDNHKAIEQATVIVENRTNSSTRELPERWSRVDEWYNFTKTVRGKAEVIASLDEKSFHGGTMGADHPVVWTKKVGKGRLWYTALGHTEDSYSEPLFAKHVLGGIWFAAAGTGHELPAP